MCHTLVSSANSALVIAPSPLAGEGCSVPQRARVGEGAKLMSVPLTPQNSLRHFHALSRRGRGRSNERRIEVQSLVRE